MIASDREHFVKLMMAAAELYGKETSQTLVKLYWKMLEIYDFEDVSKAFQVHFQDPDAGQFMPKPADVIKIIKGNSQIQSLEAWSKVDKAIRAIGPYHSVVFDDPVIHSVVHDMGGWTKLCNISGKEQPFVAKEFQTRYTAFKFNQARSYPSKLTGITDHQNLLQGHPTTEPYLIGETVLAQQILENGKDENSFVAIQHISKQLCLGAQ